MVSVSGVRSWVQRAMVSQCEWYEVMRSESSGQCKCCEYTGSVKINKYIILGHLLINLMNRTQTTPCLQCRDANNNNNNNEDTGQLMV